MDQWQQEKRTFRWTPTSSAQKLKKLYETFADSEEQDDAEPGPSKSAFHAESNSFNASKGRFDKFQQRFGLKSVTLHGEAASANAAGAKAYVNKYKKITEEGGYKPEQVFNMDETGLFWKRMPSRTFIMQDEAKASGFKVQKDHVTLGMCGNAAGFMIKKQGLFIGQKIQ